MPLTGVVAAPTETSGIAYNAGSSLALNPREDVRRKSRAPLKACLPLVQESVSEKLYKGLVWPRVEAPPNPVMMLFVRTLCCGMKRMPFCCGRIARAASPSASGRRNEAQTYVQFLRAPILNSFTRLGDRVDTTAPVRTCGFLEIVPLYPSGQLVNPACVD